jgi:hypothetical protein
MHPEMPAIKALAFLFAISMRVLQVPQLVAEKLFNSTNFLKEIRLPQLGQQAFWFLDIGYRLGFAGNNS